MGWQDITEGTKIGTAKAMRRDVSQEKKTPFVEVAFDFEEPSTGTIERLFWQGWCTEKSFERTMDTLKNVLGFSGNDQVNDNGHFTAPDVLDWARQVELTVKRDNSYVNDKGETKPGRMKIQWVNALGGGSQFAKSEPEEIKKAWSGINLKAEFLKAGGKTKKSAPVSNSDVPF